MRRAKIEVFDYDPAWKASFEKLQSTLFQKLEEPTIEIIHVGSTSIPGMSAKAVLDIDIVIKDDLALQGRIIKRLTALGYRHVGDLGISGRESFKRPNEKIPDIGTDKSWMKHHLYLCHEGSIGLENHLMLKKYLLNHPDKMVEYGRLKKELAAKYPFDMDRYIDGKTDFIIQILAESGMQKERIDLIETENKL